MLINNIMTCSWIDIIREPKIFGMAIFDWTATLIAVYIITWFVNKRYPGYGFIKMFIVLAIITTIVAIIVHKIFGINTMLNYYLGLNPKPKRIKCI